MSEEYDVWGRKSASVTLNTTGTDLLTYLRERWGDENRAVRSEGNAIRIDGLPPGHGRGAWSFLIQLRLARDKDGLHVHGECLHPECARLFEAVMQGMAWQFGLLQQSTDSTEARCGKQDTGEDGPFAVRLSLLYAIWNALTDLLQTHCTGYVGIQSPQVDAAYIELYQSLQRLLGTEGMGGLREGFPANVPESLHDVDLSEADEEWELILSPTVSRYTGEILKVCVEQGVDLSDQVLGELFWKYHGVAKQLRRMKAQTWERLLHRVKQEHPDWKRSASTDAPSAIPTAQASQAADVMRKEGPATAPTSGMPVAVESAAPVQAKDNDDPLAAIPGVADRDFARRWNAGEDPASLASDFGLRDAHAVGNKAHALRKVFPHLVKYRRNQGNWLEDDKE